MTLEQPVANQTVKTPSQRRKIIRRVLFTIGLTIGITAGYVLLFPSYIGNRNATTHPGATGVPTADGMEISFTGFDQLAHVGEEVVLKTKLETKLIKNDIDDEPVLCRVAGRELGEAITDEEGFATWRFTPGQTGDYEIIFHLPDTTQYRPQQTPALLAVRTDDKPIIVSDLDHTIIDIKTYQFFLHDNEKIPPLPHLPEILQELAVDYDIIYLTARDDMYVNVTKNWLDMHHLPPAPLFVCDLSEDPVDQGEFKTQALKKLKENWPNLTIGIGDKIHDAEAYIANDMTAYIIGDYDQLPEKTIQVAGWKEIRELLKKPPDLNTLLENDLIGPEDLICPLSDNITGEISYIYRGSDLPNDVLDDNIIPDELILAYDKMGNHIHNNVEFSRNVLFANYSVRRIESDDFAAIINRDNELRRELGLPEKPDGIR